jgi:hypothetical protein
VPTPTKPSFFIAHPPLPTRKTLPPSPEER